MQILRYAVYSFCGYVMALGFQNRKSIRGTAEIYNEKKFLIIYLGVCNNGKSKNSRRFISLRQSRDD